MASVLSCGFVRSLILAGTKIYHSSVVYDKIYEDFERCFSANPNFEETKKYLTGCFKSYAKFIKDKKVSTTIKDQVNEKYTMEAWEKLPLDAREAHSLKDCQVVSSPILSF